MKVRGTFCFLLPPYPPLPYRFPRQDVKDLIVREAEEGGGEAEMSGILAGDDRFVGAEHRTYCIKQINRPGDDVSHLFRAVVTLWINHIAGAAVQTHFRRLQCLVSCFFSLSLNISLFKYVLILRYFFRTSIHTQ